MNDIVAQAQGLVPLYIQIRIGFCFVLVLFIPDSACFSSIPKNPYITSPNININNGLLEARL